MILEEAEKRCGSREKLQCAVARGAIRVSTVDGVELYFFPKVPPSVIHLVVHLVVITMQGTRRKSINTNPRLCMHNININLNINKCVPSKDTP